MNLRSLLLPSFLALSGLCLSGCISSSETRVSDPERVRVAFASERAGRLFYEALSRDTGKAPRNESRTRVDLILIDVEQRVVTGPNHAFNAAVAQCDTDRDGTITKTEAEIFAAASTPKA